METSAHTPEELKKLVRDKYAGIAAQSHAENTAPCCGGTDTGAGLAILMADEYTHLPGYVAHADLGLGCGLPTRHARLRPGDTVVDLGSGAGNDCFVARQAVGASGRVIGVDMTEAMIEKARRHAAALGFDNVEFHLGDIENLPLPACTAHVVVSNCVMNLVPDKARAFAEAFRVLKPGGHFSISDVVLRGRLPAALQQDAALYAGCVAGALPKAHYLAVIEQAGFENICVQAEKPIALPADLLRRHLGETEAATFGADGTGLFSITVYAEKPGNGMGVGSSVCC